MKLPWGGTPWDDLGREELLEHVRRLYSANHAALSVLQAMADAEPAPYWSSIGSGGRALAKARQAETAALAGHCPGELYRSFYRYADDLLFASPVGFGWRICPDGHMTGSTPGQLEGVGCFLCKAAGREVPVRPLIWADLRP